jgi:hypothetical protein
VRGDVRLCAGGFLGQSALILYQDQEAYSALGRVAGPVLSEGKSFRAEIQLKRKDGSLFWCRVSAKAVDPERPRDGTLWIIEDMSEDHLMLEALERSTLELTAILDTASIGIAVVRNREFVRCNRRFEELFDLDPGSLVGQSSRCCLTATRNSSASASRCMPSLPPARCIGASSSIAGATAASPGCASAAAFSTPPARMPVRSG